MFDWARGSTLKEMVRCNIPLAGYDPWLKKWAYAWSLALLEIPQGSKVIDVGSGSSARFAGYLVQQGCDVHVLDVKYDPATMQDGWGYTQETVQRNPEITFHDGLAGQGTTPGEHFDLVTCISVMEHVYDHVAVVDPKAPFRHLDALRDMVRILKPGGLLVVTYDFFLNDLAHHRGWDYLMDIQTLQASGVPLASRERSLRSRTYLYNHEDTLFMHPEGVLSFSDQFLRLTSVGMVFRKPGASASVRFSPRRDLRHVLFPASEIASASSTNRSEPLSGEMQEFTAELRRTISALASTSQRLEHDGEATPSEALVLEDFRLRELARALLVRLYRRLRGRV